MLGESMYTTIQTLWKKGLNKSEISRMTKHDWKTVSKVIHKLESGQLWPEKKPHSCLLDSHRKKILELIEKGLSVLFG